MKQTQFRKWFKTTQAKLTVVSFIIGLISGSLPLVLSIYAVYSDAMLQSITQAEATILGFFGLIAAYLLTSYDARLDRLEQQRFELETAGKQGKVDSISKRLKQIRRRKIESTTIIVMVGAVLIISLLSSITTQGIRTFNPSLATVISACSLMLMFLGTYGVFFLFLIISKEPELSNTESNQQSP
jgi:hypothetical protein